jgi:hypothetical protein
MIITIPKKYFGKYFDDNFSVGDAADVTIYGGVITNIDGNDYTIELPDTDYTDGKE